MEHSAPGQPQDRSGPDGTGYPQGSVPGSIQGCNRGEEAFPWLDFLEFHHAEIDRDHREAVAEGNTLVRLIEGRDSWPDVVRLLHQARGRCQRHFGTEDRILAETRYPEHERHRSAHDAILREFDRILAELDRVQAPEPQHWALASRPRDLLVDHCLQDDLQFKSHLMDLVQARPG